MAYGQNAPSCKPLTRFDGREIIPFNFIRHAVSKLLKKSGALLIRNRVDRLKTSIAIHT